MFKSVQIMLVNVVLVVALLTSGFDQNPKNKKKCINLYIHGLWIAVCSPLHIWSHSMTGVVDSFVFLMLCMDIRNFSDLINTQ